MTSGIFASVDAIAALVMGVVIPATGLRVRLGDPNYGFAQGQNRRNRDWRWAGGVASGSLIRASCMFPCWRAWRAQPIVRPPRASNATWSFAMRALAIGIVLVSGTLLCFAQTSREPSTFFKEHINLTDEQIADIGHG